MNNQKCQTCSKSILVLSGQIDRLGTLNKPSISFTSGGTKNMYSRDIVDLDYIPWPGGIY